MTPIAVALMAKVAHALEADTSLADVAADCYWWHAPGQKPRQPQLFLVLAIPSAHIGGPPIIGSVPVTLPLADQATITGVVRGAVGAMRAERRAMLQ